jgi:hypothetical protein
MFRKLKWLFGAMMLGILLGFAAPVQAADTGANFTVSPAAYPSEQVGGDLGYFQLKVSPNQTGSVGIKIQNYGTTDQSFTVTPTKATTNAVGQINYAPTKHKLDRSAQYNLTQLLSKKQTVTVPAKTTKTVTFTYQIPKKGFKGMLLGGFYVYSNTRKTGTNSNVTNRFAMTIGISMSQNAPHRLAPKLKMGSAKTANHGDNLTAVAKLRNVQPTYFRGMRIQTTVTKPGHKKVLYRQHTANGSMAPTSNFNYTMNVGQKITTPGRYLAHITIKARGKTWHFNRPFTISATTATKQITHVNRWGAVWWLWAIIIVLILAIVGGFFYWLGARKKR